MPVPTVSNPAATSVIGKEAGRYAAALAGEIDTSDARMVQVYGQAADSWGLVVQALGFLPKTGIADEAACSPSQLRELAHERSRPRSSTSERVTRAVVRHAAGELHAWGLRDSDLLLPGERGLPVLAAFVAKAQAREGNRTCRGCESPLTGSQGSWCSDACRKRTARRSQPPVTAQVQAADPVDVITCDGPGVDEAIELLARIPGIPPAPLGIAMMRKSPRLPGVIADCLAAGSTPEQLAELVRTDGPLNGRSPVGILVSRLAQLAPVLAEERRSAPSTRSGDGRVFLPGTGWIAPIGAPQQAQVPG